MGKEIERKFLLDEDHAISLDSMEESELLSIHEITQVYLKEDQSVSIHVLGGDTPKWVIEKDSLRIEVSMPTEDHQQLVGLFGDNIGGDVSLEPKSAARIRFKRNFEDEKQEVIFTYKLPGEDFAHEYEYTITKECDIESAHAIAQDIPERVSKIRKTYQLDNHHYELDIFMGFAFILLEVEFKTVEESKNYVLKCDSTCEVTGHRAYSNDSIASAVGNHLRNPN
ncbi:hypothetical protein LMH73_026940 [Vibrio splendidus]|nr:hypothetical protein [Vibrio splendidus]MCC4880509.1 hypothetical protein [Vibrio splendidus]